MTALVRQHERALTEYGLLTPIQLSRQLELIREDDARLSDLGFKILCEH